VAEAEGPDEGTNRADTTSASGVDPVTLALALARASWLKSGEAAVHVCNFTDAKPPFARTARLDLTESEKSELARMTW